MQQNLFNYQDKTCKIPVTSVLLLSKMNKYSKPASIIPPNDEERLLKLHGYEILDTPPEEAFDKIAKLAAQIFGTPSAFVTFVDKERVFFKSNISPLEGNQVERKDSLCSLAILEDSLTCFDDTHQIPDLMESPHVSCEGGIRFYAGAPLRTSEGYQLGTLCVTDSVPRKATPEQLKMLETLSSVVVDQLELRQAARRAVRVQTDLMNIAVHDLKGPAANIALLSDLMLKKVPRNETVSFLVDKMKVSVGDIRDRLNDLLNLSQIENGDIKLNFEAVDIHQMLVLVKSNFELLASQKGQKIVVEDFGPAMANVDRVRMKEIFENLLSNAIKYSYKDSTITLSGRKEEDAVVVEFRDQGQGLSSADMKKLFTKFSKLSSVPTGKERSNGLGLSIVKTLVELHRGKVWANSEGKEKGTSFFVKIPF